MPKAYRRSARPRLEILEDRLAPAAFHIDHLADDMIGANGTGSLRYCIDQANRAGGANMIDIPFYDTIHLSSTLQITSDVTISGINSTGTIIQRDYLTNPVRFRLFDIIGSAGSPLTVTINHLALSGGNAGDSDGGAVRSNYTALTLTGCNIYYNYAANGGGVEVENGSLAMSQSGLDGNAAAYNGAGIRAVNASVTVSGTRSSKVAQA